MGKYPAKGWCWKHAGLFPASKIHLPGQGYQGLVLSLQIAGIIPAKQEKDGKQIKQNPRKRWVSGGFYLVAEAGFEPTTFGL